MLHMPTHLSRFHPKFLSLDLEETLTSAEHTSVGLCHAGPPITVEPKIFKVEKFRCFR
jgi:hypothetical protein